MTKSIRVQMSTETEEKLLNLAKQYKCFYNKNPSLSLLFAKIGKEELTIIPHKSIATSNTFNTNESNLDLIILSMNCPFCVNGIVAKVTEKIAKQGGNIFKIDARHEHNNIGILKVYFSLGINEQKNIDNLMSDISSLKLKDIYGFNNEDSWNKASQVLPSENKTRIENNQTILIEEKNKEEYKFFFNISYSFGLEIELDNRGGLLQIITRKIAREKILISFVKQDFSFIDNIDIIKLLLEIKYKEDRNNFRNKYLEIKKIINHYQFSKDKYININIRRLNTQDINDLE